MASWTLYILRCSDSSLYTGITTDLDKRLKRHNKGKASKYTRSRKPVKVVYTEIIKNESLAKKREIEIKQLSRANKLKMIKYFPRGLEQRNRAARDEIFRQKDLARKFQGT